MLVRLARTWRPRWRRRGCRRWAGLQRLIGLLRFGGLRQAGFPRSENGLCMDGQGWVWGFAGLGASLRLATRSVGDMLDWATIFLISKFVGTLKPV